MIILDDDEQQPKLRLPEPGRFADPRVAGRSSSVGLPDYETSQAQHQVQETSHVQHPPYDKHGIQRRVDARFWKATAYAMMIYIALSVTVALVIVKSIQDLRFRAHSPPPIHWSDNAKTSNGTKYSLESNLPMLLENPHCNQWTALDDSPGDDLHSATMDYGCSPSGTFTLRSNVSDSRKIARHAFGSLTVDINPDQSVTDAHISVRLRTSSPELQMNSYVCVEPTTDGTDLLIFAPGDLLPNDTIIFDISLLFPHTSTSLKVPQLTTYLPRFDQKFGKLGPSVRFKEVDIGGSLSNISAEALHGRKIQVKSRYGAITGTFNTSMHLTLDTIEAPIDVNVTMVWYDKGPTSFDADTGNGALDARVTLLAPSTYSFLSKDAPFFMTNLQTFSAPLSLDIIHASSTPTSTVNVHARNHLAESRVRLDGKFQGTFEVQTKLASAVVERPPSGFNTYEDQRQLIFDTTTEDRIFGWVGFGSRPDRWHTKGQGHVSVESSLGPAYLDLE